MDELHRLPPVEQGLPHPAQQGGLAAARAAAQYVGGKGRVAPVQGAKIAGKAHRAVGGQKEVQPLSLVIHHVKTPFLRRGKVGGAPRPSRRKEGRGKSAAGAAAHFAAGKW